MLHVTILTVIIRKRNAPFIWIKAFSLLSGYLLTHGQKPGTLASTLIPAIKKVDEMVKPDIPG